jgi:hypothetical protein
MGYAYYRTVVERPPDYQAGDPVRAVDDDTLGTIQFARTDGWCCVVWQTGRREWVHTSQLASWRGMWWDVALR